MFKYLNFAPDDGGDDLGGDDTKEKTLDVPATLKALNEQVATLSGVADSVKKAQDAGMGASRKVDKLAKDLGKLEGQFTGLTDNLGKFSEQLEKMTPKEPTADDKLSGMFKGDGKDAVTPQEVVKTIQESLQTSIKSSLEDISRTIAKQSEERTAAIEAKFEAAQWNSLLDKNSIPEDMKSFIPVGDKDKLEQVKKIAEALAKGNADAGTTTTTVDGKTIDIKEPGEPIPSGAGEATNTKSAEMTAKMEKHLKDGDLDKFHDAWSEAADKKIPIDGERMLALFEKAGHKKAQADRDERRKVHI